VPRGTVRGASVRGCEGRSGEPCMRTDSAPRMPRVGTSRSRSFSFSRQEWSRIRSPTWCLNRRRVVNGFTRARLHPSTDQIDERCLSGAVGSDERTAGALFQPKAHVARDLERSEAFRQPADIQYRMQGCGVRGREGLRHRYLTAATTSTRVMTRVGCWHHEVGLTGSTVRADNRARPAGPARSAGCTAPASARWGRARPNAC